MKCYRISKYNPIYRNKAGIYQREDWTSFWDIGRFFNGVKLTLDEYERVENKYLSVALDVLDLYNISELNIRMTEMRSDVGEIKVHLRDKGVSLCKKDEYILNNITSMSKISIEDFPDLFKLVLKEYFWCVLEEREKIIIEFGYDFYLYIYCENIPKDIVEKNSDIFVEEIQRDMPDLS